MENTNIKRLLFLKKKKKWCCNLQFQSQKQSFIHKLNEQGSGLHWFCKITSLMVQKKKAVCTAVKGRGAWTGFLWPKTFWKITFLWPIISHSLWNMLKRHFKLFITYRNVFTDQPPRQIEAFYVTKAIKFKHFYIYFSKSISHWFILILFILFFRQLKVCTCRWYCSVRIKEMKSRRE